MDREWIAVCTLSLGLLGAMGGPKSENAHCPEIEQASLFIAEIGGRGWQSVTPVEVSELWPDETKQEGPSPDAPGCPERIVIVQSRPSQPVATCSCCMRARFEQGWEGTVCARHLMNVAVSFVGETEREVDDKAGHLLSALVSSSGAPSDTKVTWQGLSAVWFRDFSDGTTLQSQLTFEKESVRGKWRAVMSVALVRFRHEK